MCMKIKIKSDYELIIHLFLISSLICIWKNVIISKRKREDYMRRINIVLEKKKKEEFNFKQEYHTHTHERSLRSFQFFFIPNVRKNLV